MVCLQSFRVTADQFKGLSWVKQTCRLLCRWPRSKALEVLDWRNWLQGANVARLWLNWWKISMWQTKVTFMINNKTLHHRLGHWWSQHCITEHVWEPNKNQTNGCLDLTSDLAKHTSIYGVFPQRLGNISELTLLSSLCNLLIREQIIWHSGCIWWKLIQAHVKS